MRTFIVTVYGEDNGKKIQFIREIRAALGIGLTEAKELVETIQYQDQQYILNGNQVANLVAQTHGECSGGLAHPYLRVKQVVPVATPRARDFSSLNPL